MLTVALRFVRRVSRPARRPHRPGSHVRDPCHIVRRSPPIRPRRVTEWRRRHPLRFARGPSRLPAGRQRRPPNTRRGGSFSCCSSWPRTATLFAWLVGWECLRAARQQKVDSLLLPRKRAAQRKRARRAHRHLVAMLLANPTLSSDAAPPVPPRTARHRLLLLARARLPLPRHPRPLRRRTSPWQKTKRSHRALLPLLAARREGCCARRAMRSPRAAVPRAAELRAVTCQRAAAQGPRLGPAALRDFRPAGVSLSAAANREPQRLPLRVLHLRALALS